MRDLVSSRVSIIVPCYNVEAYLQEFINSLILQTYKNLEIILVNDGANLATTELLRSSVPLLQSEGYIVRLIEQANKGLGGAVDTGLKYFTGEFLMWPDPDDWLTSGSIDRRVELFRQNPDIGLLRSNARLFIEARQEFDGYFMPLDVQSHRTCGLFEDLLFMRNFFAPVCHMVRSEMFLAVHPERSIYFSKMSSQNFQLLVPFVESFPVLQVHEPLAVYRIREDSRSRAPNQSREKLIERFDQLMELTIHTLPKLKTWTPERQRLLLNFHWRNRMLPTAIRAAMENRCRDLVNQSDLAVWRKSLAKMIISVRCSNRFQRTDKLTGSVASRLLARCLDRLVRLPSKQMKWGAAPLWN